MKLQPWVLACSVALVLAVLAVPNPSRGRIRDKAVHSSPDNATAPDAEIKAAKDVEPKQVAVYKEGYQPPGFTGGRKRLSSSTKPFDVFALFQNDDIVIIFDDFVVSLADDQILNMKVYDTNVYFQFMKMNDNVVINVKTGTAGFTQISNSQKPIKVILTREGEISGDLGSAPGKIEFNVTKLQDGTEGVKLTFDPATLKSAAMDLSFETPLANYDAASAAGAGMSVPVMVAIGIVGSIAAIAAAVLVPCLLCEACCLHQRFCAKPDEEEQEKGTTAATKHQSKEKKNKKRKAEDKQEEAKTQDKEEAPKQESKQESKRKEASNHEFSAKEVNMVADSKKEKKKRVLKDMKETHEEQNELRRDVSKLHLENKHQAVDIHELDGIVQKKLLNEDLELSMQLKRIKREEDEKKLAAGRKKPVEALKPKVKKPDGAKPKEQSEAKDQEKKQAPAKDTKGSKEGETGGEDEKSEDLSKEKTRSSGSTKKGSKKSTADRKPAPSAAQKTPPPIILNARKPAPKANFKPDVPANSAGNYRTAKKQDSKEGAEPKQTEPPAKPGEAPADDGLVTCVDVSNKQKAKTTLVSCEEGSDNGRFRPKAPQPDQIDPDAAG